MKHSHTNYYNEQLITARIQYLKHLICYIKHYSKQNFRFTPGCAMAVMTFWLIPRFSLMIVAYEGRVNASAPWDLITVTSTLVNALLCGVPWSKASTRIYETNKMKYPTLLDPENLNILFLHST